MESKRSLFKFYRSYFDVGQELDDVDRLAFYDALLNREFFGIEPNLKGISKLAYISQKHSIDAQIKGWEEKTKTKLLDPIIGGSLGGIQGGSIQVKEKEEEKEKEKVKLKEYIPALPKFSFFSELVNYGFEKNLVEDWLKVRKTKKATNTQTAFKNFILEIELRECNINEILEICVDKSWSGFKWSWYDNLKQQSKSFNNGRIEKTSEQLANDLYNSEAARNFKFS